MKKGFRRNFAKFTGKQLCQSLFYNKVAGLWHSCFLRTRFFIEHLGSQVGLFCRPTNIQKLFTI